jgi:hypothetical protein
MKHVGARLAIVGTLGIIGTSCINDDSEINLASVTDQITGDFVSVIDQPGGSVVFSAPYTLTSSQFNGVPPYSFTWLRNGTGMPECPGGSSCTFWPPVPMYGDYITLTAQDAAGNVSSSSVSIIGVCPGGGYFC